MAESLIRDARSLVQHLLQDSLLADLPNVWVKIYQSRWHESNVSINEVEACIASELGTSVKLHVKRFDGKTIALQIALRRGGAPANGGCEGAEARSAACNQVDRLPTYTLVCMHHGRLCFRAQKCQRKMLCNWDWFFDATQALYLGAVLLGVR
eukprot:1183250-Prorocentrum_minimum.AAC.4